MPFDYQISIPKESFTQVANTFKQSKRVLIMPHKGMDGDALGSALGLSMVLEKAGIPNTVASVDEAIGSVFSYIPWHERIVKDFNEKDFDTLVYVDHSELSRAGYHENHPNLETNIPNKVVIDHHQIDPNLDCNGGMLLDTQSPATALIIYHLLPFLGVHLDKDLGTALLTSIYTDTGGFMHNTTQEVLEVSSELSDLGADFESISKNIFRTKPVTQLKLWGKVIDRAYRTKHNILFSAITLDEVEESGATAEDLAGVVAMLNAVPDVRFVIFAYEKPGGVKASMRTQHDDVDLSAIAKVFGGGGHKKAAGFFIPGKLKKRTCFEVTS